MCAAFPLSFNTYFSLERALSGPGFLQCPFAGLLMLLTPGLSSALRCCSDATNHPASTSFSKSHQIVQPGMNPAPQRVAAPWACLSWAWLGLEDSALESLRLPSFARGHFGDTTTLLLLLLPPGISPVPCPRHSLYMSPRGKFGTKPAWSSSVGLDFQGQPSFVGLI